MPELLPDTQLQVKQDSALLVPDDTSIAPVDYVLTVTGESPFQYDWRQPPRPTDLKGHGDPNGLVFAEKGSLFVDLDGAPDLYINSDGNTTWILKGATGATGASGLLGILWPGVNALLSADTFTTTWGTTNGAGSLDPLTWTTNNGTWTVASGQAKLSTLSLAPARAYLALGTGDVDLSLTVATRDAGTLGSAILFRYLDASNYWMWECTAYNSNMGCVLTRKKAGTNVNIGSFHASADGDVMRVVAYGPWIAALRNGVIQELVFDGFNMTQANHGMSTNSTSSRFDDFSARTP